MNNQASIDLDKIDRKLLAALQKDARLTVAQLADMVALSHSPCWRRIHRLEEAGLISGYHARLDRAKLGYGVLGFVSVQMENHTLETSTAFEQMVVALPEVISCHNLSGRYDYQIEALGTDLESFSRFVRERLRVLPGVKEISTNFSLKEVKRAGTLPV